MFISLFSLTECYKEWNFKSLYIQVCTHAQRSTLLGHGSPTLCLSLLLYFPLWSARTSETLRKLFCGEKKKPEDCIWLVYKGDKDLHMQLWEIISKSPQQTALEFITTWWKVIKINLKGREKMSKNVKAKNDVPFSMMSTRTIKVPLLKCYLYFSVNLFTSKKPHLLGLLQRGHMD